MARSLIETFQTDVPLASAPINPSWILEGNPTAENAVLARSADGTATTIVWRCSAGRFEWHYDFDETIHLLEGSIVLESEGMKPTRFGPGDVIFFRNGAKATWTVEGHVRKLAFCRTTQLPILGFAQKVIGKLSRMLKPAAARPVNSLGVAG